MTRDLKREGCLLPVRPSHPQRGQALGLAGAETYQPPGACALYANVLGERLKLDPSAFFVATDLKRQNHLMIDSSDHWTPYKLPFSTDGLDYTEIRFVIQAPGTFWITDVRHTSLGRAT